MKERVVAFDPGGTVGYAVLAPPLSLTVASEVRADDEDALQRAIECVVALANIVVVEEFRLYPWRSDKLSWDEGVTQQVIGRIRAECQKRRKPVVMQPASVKRLVPNDVLKAADIDLRGPHAMDAARHALYYAWHRLGYKDAPEVLDLLKRLASGAPLKSRKRRARG